MPPTPIAYPLVNGNRFDFSCVEADILGRRFVGIKEITYSDSLEPGMVKGAHAQTIGRTRGEYKAEAAITFYREEYDEVLALLGDGFYEKEFTISVAYDNGSGRIANDRIVSCRMKKSDNSASGTDALEVKVELSVMYIERNGKKPLIKMLGAV